MKYEETIIVPKAEIAYANYLLELFSNDFYYLYGTSKQINRKIIFPNGNIVRIFIHGEEGLSEIYNEKTKVDIKIFNMIGELQIVGECFSNQEYIQTYRFSCGGDDYVITLKVEK